MVQLKGKDLLLLNDYKIGVEREALRVNRDGTLALTPHPPALKKPHFTRDFSESQIEIVTSPADSIDSLLRELESLHDEANRELGDELLWPMSTPPTLPPENLIPVADMGSDEAGHAGSNYRRGLVTRYGKHRQMISGVHINISAGGSLTQFLSHNVDAGPMRIEDYLNLSAAALFVEKLPTILLLTGASVYGGSDLQSDDELVVSFRNSAGGYAGHAYREYFSLDSIQAYTGQIEKAMNTESEVYRSMGLVDDGRLVQLNTKVFQSEKEFYAPVRLKRAGAPGGGQLSALKKEGSQYLELRYADVDPGYAVGIGRDALMLARLIFTHALLNLDRDNIELRTNSALRKNLDRADEAAAFSIAGLSNGAAHGLLSRAESDLGELLGTAIILDIAEGSGDYLGLIQKYLNQLRHVDRLKAVAIADAYTRSNLTWDEFGTETALMCARNKREVETYA